MANVASDDVLNVRASPTAKARIVGAIPPNAKNVEVTGSGVSNGRTLWLPIAYKEMSGWANAKYLVTGGRDPSEGGARRSSTIARSTEDTSSSQEVNDADRIGGAEAAVLGIGLGIAAAKGIFNWIGSGAGSAASWASSNDSGGVYRYTVECTGTTFSGLPKMTYSGTINAQNFNEASTIVRNEQSQNSCHERFGSGYAGDGYVQFDHQ